MLKAVKTKWRRIWRRMFGPYPANPDFLAECEQAYRDSLADGEPCQHYCGDAERCTSQCNRTRRRRPVTQEQLDRAIESISEQHHRLAPKCRASCCRPPEG